VGGEWGVWGKANGGDAGAEEKLRGALRKGKKNGDVKPTKSDDRWEHDRELIEGQEPLLGNHKSGGGGVKKGTKENSQIEKDCDEIGNVASI